MSKGVAVIGGGIAGVQAALDLAEQGIKVFLIEKMPSLGGKMAQLDKTFPTNDCSMCILSPKLVEVGRHPNIELLTLSEIEELNGDVGEFKVKVLKRARYVDENSCTGCGICANSCPVSYQYQIPENVSVQEQIPKDDLSKIDSILGNYVDEEGVLISVLQDINEEFNYLPENALRYISEMLDIPLSQIYHVATFYTAFSLTPRGEHLIRVCQGTACHVRGTGAVLDEISRVLGVKSGETTENLQYTLETVNCLGACALGPVVVLDDEYHGNMSPGKIKKILKMEPTEEGAESQ
jgi:NADH:ubiquinone oxidoreductase subunit E